MARRKPLEGHRYGGLSRGFSTSCECGWRSVTFYGKGGMAGAIGEWHFHIRKCEPASS